MKYIDQIQLGMDLLASHKDTIFVGQAMDCPGHAISRQVEKYPLEKRLEFPVAEEFQAGFCLGLALENYIPVCIYPRWNFAILAVNQIVNHIDKWPLIVPNSTKPKIIIIVAAGSKTPLNAGKQHTQNFTEAFKSMCETINVVDLTSKEMIYDSYCEALNRTDGISTILVQYPDKYDE